MDVVHCGPWVYVSIRGAGEGVPLAGTKTVQLGPRFASARRVLVLDHNLICLGRRAALLPEKKGILVGSSLFKSG